MKEKPFFAEIFLVSLAMILLEISYTRVFSYKLYYYFTYLIIGISLLGIGSGGVFVAISRRLRHLAPSQLIGHCCFAGGVTVAAGYFVVADVQLNMLQLTNQLTEALKLGIVCTFLFTPFLLAGIVVATILGTRPDSIGWLYFADLSGAGLGCAVCVPLMYLLTPPGLVLFAGCLLFVAGLSAARSSGRRSVAIGVLGALALVLLALFPALLPDPVPDESKTMSPQTRGDSPVLFSQWSPVFRIDVMESGEPDFHLINHDGLGGSTLHRFNGDESSLARFDSDPRSYPFRLLAPQPRVVLIGAAGGHEILASLHFGASHVTGVELNPITVSLLTTHFADYSGHLAENPRVTLVNNDGRSFLRRDRTKYDLIWFVAPDSYSAMNAATSGAFVLSESYLYTTGMVRESVEHLTDQGVVCMQFGEVSFDQKPNRTLRYLSTARAAFKELGIDDFARHVLVNTSPAWPFAISTILLKKTPFSPTDVERFAAASSAVSGSIIRHAWGHVSPQGAVHTVIAASGTELNDWYEHYPYNVRAITDDAPFFWHFVRLRDAALGRADSFFALWDRDATGERVLLFLLVFVTVFAATFLLLPFVMLRGEWRDVPFKLPAAVYFAAIGLGFMFFEVALIQQFTLFLGYPTYSLSVTLFALLISTGVGSVVSSRYAGQRNRALLMLLGGLVGLVFVYQSALGPMIERLIGLDLGIRIALAVFCMAPLGFCLGAFMPLGLATVSAVTDHAREFIAWGWAVNGFFSVISSILTTILSMTIGFRMLLFAAVIVYMVGVLAVWRIPAPAPRSP